MGSEDWISLRDVDAFRLAKHRPDGVIAIRGSETKVHHPDCPHVTEDGFLEKLRNGRQAYYWAADFQTVRSRWGGAKVCGHPSDPLNGGAGGPEALRTNVGSTAPRIAATWEIDGPGAELRAVRVFADRSLPYEPRTDEQRTLRAEMRKRLRRLVTRPDEILHAAFFGPKAANADIENLLLYNVDDGATCFVGGRMGLRFEWSPLTPASAPRPCTYLYRPVPRSAGLKLWEADESRAATVRATLVAHPRERLRTWLALRTAPVNLPAAPLLDEPLAVSVRLSPPSESSSIGDGAASVVKPVLDAFIAALQTDPAAEPGDVVRERLARETGALPDEVAALLADADRAVLGAAPKLFRPRLAGLQLCPSDERCVAGEILIGPPSASGLWEVVASVMPAKSRRRV